LKAQVKCVLCGARTSRSAPAVISPWIRDLGIKKKTSRFLKCVECDFGFFSYRYNAQEMSKIYSGYRNEKYLQIRNNWEPWYSDSYNSNHDSPNWIHSRKIGIEQFLIPIIGESVSSIADIGGDSGQFIPDFASRKFVIDPSRKTATAGVESVIDFKDLPDVDLILYAHVLEHVADPVLEINTLFAKTPRVYIEVPLGVPRITKRRRSYLRYLEKLLRSFLPILWRNETRPSSGRTGNNQSILTQSEHINFFSEKAMNQLSKRVNARIKIRIAEIETPDYMKAEVLQCLLIKLHEPSVGFLQMWRKNEFNKSDRS
jgi:hypothetical protein